MSNLRVIAGKAKGRRLKMVPGRGTRPVSDRVKEAVFNILGRGVMNSRFLDLFAGTGSVGIEALSRGAVHVRFVEKDRRAIDTIRENLEIAGFKERAEVVQGDVFQEVNFESSNGFDYVYVAPPQYHGLWERTLLKLDQHASWVYPDGLILVQIDPKEEKAVELQNFREIDRRRYGNTAVLFYERSSDIMEDV
jgi:16S rRNA (guanine(966)-N(2))-methyltransferase RsmD